ncbi:helix-turn-helix transcriptional regulator [Cellulomonas cellasea]|uniref:helix-turn-helix transcriptional regulator n=1 Tax=Cellulomonas cellasea TaxID=43670 RepID=UPI0025A4B7ED|nr:helix-turn-helix transcriptional regulator [Cellulomonas cellasea]MDM8083771.1 helix-turn-helix transcriptional regulator [Cellulomonas cellasea]
MWHERAHRARRDIAALAAAGLGVSDLHAAAIRVIADDVGTDLACWATIDPETLVISAMTSGETAIPPEYEPLLAQAEYAPDEPHAFAELARQGSPVARLSDLPGVERERSARLRTVWRPLGVERELRVMFMADGACWGGAGMVRSGPDFSDREVELMRSVAPVIAGATRVAVRSEARTPVAGGGGAIVVVGPDGGLRAATPAARDWRDGLDEIASGRFLTMMRVMALGARSSQSGGFRARLRGPDGRWAVLEASLLIGSDEEQTAITIEPATGDQLLGLLLTAYGLTAREREICHEVIGGHSTAEIAEHLFITTNTVQDHLKSMFAKVGVRSRGEMVARLRPEGIPKAPLQVGAPLAESPLRSE